MVLSTPPVSAPPAAPPRPRASRAQRWAEGLFFGGLLVLGLWLVRGYGVSVDEWQSRTNGIVTLKYLGERFAPAFVQTRPEFAMQHQPLAEYYDRDYGVAFELPVTWLEMTLGMPDVRHTFWLRHLCTFLVSWVGVLAVYHLARRRFADWRLGLLGATLLVLSPRLFAEGFYNDKDVVFMALFAVSTLTAVRFVERPADWRRVLAHALACALTIDVRIMGILVPLATLALLLARALGGAYRGQRGAGYGVGAYALLLPALTVACWPYLWAAPWQNFQIALASMAKFRWASTVLYRGNLVPAIALPWHYAPVWIAITTPLLYVAGFGVGVFVIIRRGLKNSWRGWLRAAPDWQDWFFLGLTLAPLAAVIGLHSVLYDGWRQLYFVYPTLLLVALRGLVALGRWQPARPTWMPGWVPARLTWARAWPVVVAASLLVTAGQMVAAHPFQNTYFNVLAGRHVEERYELDYWVLSYRRGLEWVAEHDNRPHIRVSSQMPSSLRANLAMLPEYDRARFEVLDKWEPADYYLTTYRWHAYPYTEYAEEVATVRAGGQRLLSVFRVK